jgi:hypothetical protein
MGFNLAFKDLMFILIAMLTNNTFVLLLLLFTLSAVHDVSKYFIPNTGNYKSHIYLRHFQVRDESCY